MNFNLRLMMNMLLFSALSYAQHTAPPIPVVFGNRTTNIQMTIKRDFNSNSKFSLLFIVSVSADNQDHSDNTVVIPLHVLYSISKRFSVFAGSEVNSEKGISPSLGAIHSYFNKSLVTIT